MIEVSHKQEPWYTFTGERSIVEDRLILPIFVRWGEQIHQISDTETGEPRTEYQYHMAKITHSVSWPISESDLEAILEAARPELEQRAQNAEALGGEFRD